MTADQLRYLGSVLEPYGADGCADITTRANLQVRWVRGTQGPAPGRNGAPLHALAPRRSTPSLCAAAAVIVSAALHMHIHIHTISNRQLRGVKLEDADRIVEGLIERNMSSFQVKGQGAGGGTGVCVRGLVSIYMCEP